jgi:hypothetical protein
MHAGQPTHRYVVDFFNPAEGLMPKAALPAEH